MAWLAFLPLAQWNVNFYLIPLLVAISLVYSATRYERWPFIWRNALRWALMMVIFLGVVYLFMYLLSLWLPWWVYGMFALAVGYYFLRPAGSKKKDDDEDDAITDRPNQAAEGASSLELKDRFVAGVLAWLLPGAGHVYQGRLFKGVLFAVCVLGLFSTGMALGANRGVYMKFRGEEWRYHYLAQVGAGAVALPAFFQTTPAKAMFPAGWKDLMAPPEPAQVDAANRELGKLFGIAVVFTMVAGLLNYLAIYDALAGPAHLADEEQMLAQMKKSPPSTADTPAQDASKPPAADPPDDTDVIEPAKTASED